MSASGNAGQHDGVVFTQNVTAIGDGLVNAVQHGDQYNYIYRGAPPYRVEPFDLSAPAAVSAALARVPSRLLTARHRVVPYLPHPELALLEAWRDDRAPGLSVRLVHAEGGQGKTRLAGEFAAHCAQAGWAVALARHRSEVASAGGGDEHLTVRAPGLILIVDYAERWPREDLIALVRQHRAAARDRLRILLLARPAGLWWQDLAHQFTDKLDIHDVDALKLQALPDDPTVRAAMYTAARDRFAEIFAVADPGRIKAPAHLRDPVFSLTLTVHMRALVDVDAASRGQVPPVGSDQAHLSSYLLDREHDHWLSSHDDGYGPLQTGSQAMGRTVYVATLTRALTRTDAATALARAGVADTAPASAQILEDHARCYPPEDPSLVLEPLYPDRLGEDYLALTLPGREDEFGYYATDPWANTASTLLLAPTGQDAEPALYTRQALSVLIEASHRWPHLATGHLDPLLRQHPILALLAGSAALIRLADLTTLDPAVLESIEPHIPGHPHIGLDVGVAALTQRLSEHKLATTTDPAGRAALYYNLSWRYGNAGLDTLALAPAQEAADLYRRLAAADPAAYAPRLAATLNNLSHTLSRVGRHEDALALAHETVSLARQLADADPAGTHGLAVALANSALQLSQVGRNEDALAPAQEATALHRRLAAADPSTYLPSFATSLTSLSVRLSDVGRRRDALTPAQEAVSIRRQLAELNQAVYLPDLAEALANLSIRLSDVGQQDEALNPAAEAVGAYRYLAEDNPDRYLPSLGEAVNILSVRLSTLGRSQEALPLIQEAVSIRRQLAEANPAAYLPGLAESLTNLGVQFVELGNQRAALGPAEEAALLYRQLAESSPAAHLFRLAAALNNLGALHAQLGQHQAAVSTMQEAVSIRRLLVRESPAAHLPDLPGNLANLGILLSDAGRRDEALVLTQEALAILRQLVRENPAAFLPDLAKTLTNLGAQFSELSRHKQAADVTEEAVGLLTSLAESNPTAHLPGLALVLNNQGHQLSQLGRHKKALIPAQKAVQLYLRLIETSDALMPDLALAMANLGATLSELGRRKESAAMLQEATAIRRFLETSQARQTH